jgi:hypothetical protein
MLMGTLGSRASIHRIMVVPRLKGVLDLNQGELTHFDAPRHQAASKPATASSCNGERETPAACPCILRRWFALAAFPCGRLCGCHPNGP